MIVSAGNSHANYRKTWLLGAIWFFRAILIILAIQQIAFIPGALAQTQSATPGQQASSPNAADEEQPDKSLWPISQYPCGDDLINVAFELFRNSDAEPGKPGRVEKRGDVLLRIPRGDLYLTTGISRSLPTYDCKQSSFVASEAFYNNPWLVARTLGLSFPQKWLSLASRLALTPDRSPAPVDDTSDREGTARKGGWIVSFAANPSLDSAEFCLRPPAPPDQCYATYDGISIAYKTGSLLIMSNFASGLTLRKERPPHFYGTMTVEDLDRYFGFLRAVASKVVVRSAD